LGLFEARGSLGYSLELRVRRSGRHRLDSRSQRESEYASEIVDCRLRYAVRSSRRVRLR